MHLTRTLLNVAFCLMAPDEGGGGGGGDFGFPSTVDDVGLIPQKYAGLYSKGADGKFTLDPIVGKKLDVTPLTSALDKERKQSKEHARQVAQWKALGDDPNDIAAKLQRLQELEQSNTDQDGKGKSSIEKMKRDTETTLAQLKEQHEAQVREMGESLATHLIEKEAISALASAKGSPELLTRLITDQCVLLKEDGKYVVRVVDEEGDPRSDGRGGFLTIEGLVAEMRSNPKYARAFESSGRSGGGMPPESGRRTGGTPEKLTAQQKIERGLGALNR